MYKHTRVCAYVCDGANTVGGGKTARGADRVTESSFVRRRRSVRGRMRAERRAAYFGGGRSREERWAGGVCNPRIPLMSRVWRENKNMMEKKQKKNYKRAVFVVTDRIRSETDRSGGGARPLRETAASGGE